MLLKKIKKIDKRLLIFVLVIFLPFVCFGGIHWFRAQKNSQSYIALVDGERIELNEYKIYLYLQKRRFESLGGEDIWEMDFDGQTAESLARQYALDNAVYIKISIREAERQKLVLSEDDIELSHRLAEEYYYAALQAENAVYGGLIGTIGIEDWKKVNADYVLYRKLYERTTQSFVPDMDDFSYYFQQYYENNLRNLVEIKAQVIRAGVNYLSEAQGMYQRATVAGNVSEEDFEAIAALYPDYSYNASVTIREDTFPEEVVEEAYALSSGELSPLISTDGGHYLLRIKSITKPDRQSLEEEQLAAYTTLKKNEIFDQDYKKWARNMEVVKNQKVWDELGY